MALPANNRVLVLKNDFPLIAAGMQTRAVELVDETLEELHDAIEAAAPRDRGVLAGDVEIEPAAPVAGGAQGGIHLRFYWFFREYGTSREAAAPFVTPAIERLRNPFTAKLSRLWSPRSGFAKRNRSSTFSTVGGNDGG